MELWRRFNLCLIFLLCTSLTAQSDDHNPYSPNIKCSLLPEEFLICYSPNFFNSSSNSSKSEDFICPKVEGVALKYSQVPTTSVLCVVVDQSIDCTGERSFYKGGFPCIRYSGYCFVTTLIQSVFLGCLGVDRLCLKHTCTGIGKVLTLGGLGVWWFVDIVLLLTGNLAPADNSHWCVYY
uniref:TM2 domain-containing protein 2 n=1 Tax=Ciona savignyi TaxID=51511 RepID=H2Y423_CIOSA